MSLDSFRSSYELSPIFLVNGVAANSPGQAMPLTALLQPGQIAAPRLSAQTILHPQAAINQLVASLLPNPDTPEFAHFRPVQGSTLIENEIADYPFANQTVAANSIIARPLRLSMLMICPAAGIGAYEAKLAVITALKNTLDQHNQSGGTYTIATPSFIYANCLLRLLVDVSTADSKQAQNAWQFDFEKPLLTLEEAEQTYNSMLNKIAGGLPVTAQVAGAPPSVESIGWSGQSSTTNSAILGQLSSRAAQLPGQVASVASPIGNPSSILRSTINSKVAGL